MTTSRQDHPRMKRVRIAATGMIFVTRIFWAIWLVRLLVWLIPFVFAGGMQGSRWVDDGVTLSFLHGLTYFGVWFLIILAGSYAFWMATRLLGSLRRGEFFSLVTCRQLKVFGVSVMVAMVADTVLASSLRPILTWVNPSDGKTGFVGPAYFYDAGDVSLALCGFGFCIIGWVFAEGAKIEAENKEFI